MQRQAHIGGSLPPDYQRKMQAVSVLCFAICWALMTPVVWIPLRALSLWRFWLLPDADVKLVLDPTGWWYLAGFLAMPAAAFPADFVMGRILKSQKKEFDEKWNRAFGFDGSRIGPIFAIGWTLLISIAVTAGLNWYVLLDANAFVIHDPFALKAERHQYSDVRTIRTAPAYVAPNGQIVRHRDSIVTFLDGRHWDTDMIPRQLTETQERALVDLLSKRSNVPIEDIAVFK
jgi:hypothetical protein